MKSLFEKYPKAENFSSLREEVCRDSLLSNPGDLRRGGYAFF
jgi:hypothetical protein